MFKVEVMSIKCIWPARGARGGVGGGGGVHLVTSACASSPAYTKT